MLKDCFSGQAASKVITWIFWIARVRNNRRARMLVVCMNFVDEMTQCLLDSNGMTRCRLQLCRVMRTRKILCFEAVATLDMGLLQPVDGLLFLSDTNRNDCLYPRRI